MKQLAVSTPRTEPTSAPVSPAAKPQCTIATLACQQAGFAPSRCDLRRHDDQELRHTELDHSPWIGPNATERTNHEWNLPIEWSGDVDLPIRVASARASRLRDLADRDRRMTIDERVERSRISGSHAQDPHRHEASAGRDRRRYALWLVQSESRTSFTTSARTGLLWMYAMTSATSPVGNGRNRWRDSQRLARSVR